MAEPKKVFVSYVTADRDRADTVAASLRAAGLDPWLDRERIHPGDRWADSIMQALGQSDVFLSVVSPDYLKSQHAAFDMGLAYAKRDQAKILPILVRGAKQTDLPAFMQQVAPLDLGEAPDSAAIESAIAKAFGKA